MHIAEAQVRSEQASRYLVQLCKHFAHKKPTDYDENLGRVDFQPGLCVMRAVGDRLSFRCEADSKPALDLVMKVVEVHLVRFAAREKIAVEWTYGAHSSTEPSA